MTQKKQAEYWHDVLNAVPDNVALTDLDNDVLLSFAKIADPAKRSKIMFSEHGIPHLYDPSKLPNFYHEGASYTQSGVLFRVYGGMYFVEFSSAGTTYDFVLGEKEDSPSRIAGVMHLLHKLLVDTSYVKYRTISEERQAILEKLSAI